MTRLVLFADLDRCTGCCSCVVACKEEHCLPAGLSFIRVVQVGPDGDFPDLNMYYLPVACQQCRRPACAASCPEDAITRATNGMMTVLSEKCTASGDCVAACPYDAIVLDPAQNLARKCELCPELLSAGRSPACVAICPAKALSVVDVDDAESGATAPEAGRPSRASFALKPLAGTDPSARFILTRQHWRDTL
jgi:Fe-S-cluster-containing dehydrogenase component